MAVTIYTSDFILYKLRTIVVQINCIKTLKIDMGDSALIYFLLISHPLKTIFQHKACTDKLYADSFYKVQKNSHSSFEVICCRS